MRTEAHYKVGDPIYRADTDADGHGVHVDSGTWYVWRLLHVSESGYASWQSVKRCADAAEAVALATQMNAGE